MKALPAFYRGFWNCEILEKYFGAVLENTLGLPPGHCCDAGLPSLLYCQSFLFLCTGSRPGLQYRKSNVIHDKDVWGVSVLQGAADGTGCGRWLLTALSAPSCLCNWGSLVKLHLAMHFPLFWGWLKLTVFWCRSPTGLHFNNPSLSSYWIVPVGQCYCFSFPSIPLSDCWIFSKLSLVPQCCILNYVTCCALFPYRVLGFFWQLHLKPYLTERGTSTAFKGIGIGWEKNLMQIHCLTVLALPCCPCGPSTNAINNKLFFWLKDVLLPKHKLSACYIFWMFGNLVIGFGIWNAVMSSIHCSPLPPLILV